MTVLWGHDLTALGRMRGGSATIVATDPIAEDLVDAIVIHRPGPDTDPDAVLQRCREAGVEALVVLSSARVYGASPGNDMQLDERAETASSFDDSDLAVLAEADRVLAEAAVGDRSPSDLRVTVLRPVHVMGDPASSPLVRALSQGRIRTNVGFDPIVQILHPEDVGSAVDAAVGSELHGVYNVCGPGALPLSVLARESGAVRVGGIGGVVADLGERVGLGGPARIPPSELRYPINVSDEAFRSATGWRPSHSLADTVAAAAEGHP